MERSFLLLQSGPSLWPRLIFSEEEETDRLYHFVRRLSSTLPPR